MTRVTVDLSVPRPGTFYQGVISATSHAGDRDTCVAVTWSLRTLAHVLTSLDRLEHVSQDEQKPEFVLAFTSDSIGYVVAGEVVEMLERFALERPGHLKIERQHDVRYARDCLSKSA